MRTATAIVWAALAATSLTLPAHAQAPAAPPMSEPPAYVPTEAVRAKFGAVPIALDSPAARGGWSRLTSQAELEAFVAETASRSRQAWVADIGRSQQARGLKAVVFTAEGRRSWDSVARLRRPVVWLVGQQHGDEVAGGEAMLAVLASLASGELKPLLSRVTVVVVPRANPDGAEALTRRTAADLDLNRDHLMATLPETRAIQAAMAKLAPDVVIDAHEYGGTGFWLQQFGALAPWDGTYIEATHPAVPRPLKDLTREIFLPRIEAALADQGLTGGVYLTGGGGTGTLSTGGVAPGIGRNYYGMTGAVSFLLETRESGGVRGHVDFSTFQRRVATHYVFVRAALQAAAEDGRRVRRATAEARRRLAEDGSDLIIDMDLAEGPAELVLMDPVTGGPKPVSVTLRDSRRTTPTRTRARPRGYVVDGSAAEVLAAFRAKGVLLCPLRPGVAVPVEAFKVTFTRAPDRRARESVNPEETVTVALEPSTVSPGAGSYYVPSRQTAGLVVAAALEPDAAGSYVSTGVEPVNAQGSPRFWRVATEAPPLAAGAPRACRGR